MQLKGRKKQWSLVFLCVKNLNNFHQRKVHKNIRLSVSSFPFSWKQKITTYVDSISGIVIAVKQMD